MTKMENQTAEGLNDISNLVDAVMKQKSAEGRDYYFMQKTERETYYLDDSNNVLVHHARKENGIIYLLEIEETKGEKDICQFSVYELNGQNTVKKVLGVFDDDANNSNKAQASKLFRRFRDAGNIKAELERYTKEPL